jgi:hypothetical protein
MCSTSPLQRRLPPPPRDMPPRLDIPRLLCARVLEPLPTPLNASEDRE